MKTLLPTQYQFLVAIERRDYATVIDITEREINPPNELLHRGLYTADIAHDGWYPMSARITSSGRDALMCYRAIHNLT